MRLTTRRLLILVAVIALGFSVLRFMAQVIDEAINEPFAETATTTRSWGLGPHPVIFVDCFEGSILVNPATDGRVTAQVFSLCLAGTRADAHAALETIKVSFDQHGDTLRIAARGATESGIRNEAHVTLHVPPNVRLDLRTGRGDISVGRDYKNNAPVYSPISAYSVRARNDSKCRLDFSQGNINVITAAPRDSGTIATPTRLQLDASGRIEVVADLAIVEAHAWHGTPYEGMEQTYEDGQEGSIRFDGTLAEGTHSLRAAHRLELKLTQSAAIQVRAEATQGPITGNLLPHAVDPVAGKARWAGPIGITPGGILHLRTR